MDKLDLSIQQQTALNLLIDYMIFKSNTVIEHNDLFIGDVICNKNPDLEMFRYKNLNEGVFLKFNQINIFS